MAVSVHTLEGSRTNPTGGAMLQQDALIVDYGPVFHGTALKTDSGIVCVIPRQLHPHSEAGNALRELVQGLGGNCGQCDGCPLGRQD